jgi:hypothetical protein
MGNFTFWTMMAGIIIVFITVDIMFGRVMKMYNRTKWFDLVMHFISGGLILALIGFWVSKSVWFAFFFAVAMSAIWELIEFTIDAIFRTNLQKWKDAYMVKRNAGLIDSMGDVLATLLGAMLACGIIALVI